MSSVCSRLNYRSVILTEAGSKVSGCQSVVALARVVAAVPSADTVPNGFNRETLAILGVQMSTPHDWVTGFLQRAAGGLELDRVVETCPGLDAAGVVEVLGDTRLGPLVIEALSDLMHPVDSVYYDAIFGAFSGQSSIRDWLVPAMAEVDIVEFVPTAKPEVFVRAGGSSSVDEWQMWLNHDGDRRPLSRGVSTRHCADGWVLSNTDVYDTSPLRQPNSDAEGESSPLPPPPQYVWESEPMRGPVRSDALLAWLELPVAKRGPLDHSDIHTVMVTPELGMSAEVVGPLFHPTDSRLFEPSDEYVGRDAIWGHLSERDGSRPAMTLEQIGPALFNGSCTTFEWVAKRAGGSAADATTRGTSVCRYSSGLIIYACDYYDTASPTA